MEMTPRTLEIASAYEKVAGVFDPQKALDTYQGWYVTGADFAYDILVRRPASGVDIPHFVKRHINYQAVWDEELSLVYTQADGHYFQTY